MKLPVPITLLPPSQMISGSYYLDVPSFLMRIPKQIKQFAKENGFTMSKTFAVIVADEKTVDLVSSLNDDFNLKTHLSKLRLWSVIPSEKYTIVFQSDSKGYQHQSLVVSVTCEKAEQLYEMIRRETKLNIPMPTLFITLCTKNDTRHLSVASQDAFDTSLLEDIFRMSY